MNTGLGVCRGRLVASSPVSSHCPQMLLQGTHPTPAAGASAREGRTDPRAWPLSPQPWMEQAGQARGLGVGSPGWVLEGPRGDRVGPARQ